ncbi:uncharacterized protein LOC129314321 [Prosopis cineraria]|uniref:uncharacterized protein LOC129314321 n=1 Tax=Prosopis cineraria TaxID=364024 RepID=UPI0024104800|nr:uncharacterized protein LOC129314321 [Prosopis cineraria]
MLMRAMVPTFASFSPPIPTSLPSFPLSATLPALPSCAPIFLNHPFHLPVCHPNSKLRRIRAAPYESTVVQAAQEIVSASDSDDGVSYVISALLFVAFFGLSILTLGVIYLGVTDFLQKREKDKFEKQEAANSGKQKKKKKIRARAGPKGFGQKIIDDNDE